LTPFRKTTDASVIFVCPPCIGSISAAFELSYNHVQDLFGECDDDAALSIDAFGI